MIIKDWRYWLPEILGPLSALAIIASIWWVFGGWGLGIGVVLTTSYVIWYKRRHGYDIGQSPQEVAEQKDLKILDHAHAERRAQERESIMVNLGRKTRQFLDRL